MKRWYRNLMIVTLTLLVVACSDEKQLNVINVFEKYGPLDEFTVLNFHPSVFLVIEDESQKDLRETIKKLEDVKIIKHDISSQHSDLTKHFLVDLKSNFPKDSYKDLMIVSEGKERIIFKVKENEETVEELILQIYDENSITIAQLSGDIDIEKISDLAAKFNVSELENLDILKN